MDPISRDYLDYAGCYGQRIKMIVYYRMVFTSCKNGCISFPTVFTSGYQNKNKVANVAAVVVGSGVRDYSKSRIISNQGLFASVLASGIIPNQRLFQIRNYLHNPCNKHKMNTAAVAAVDDMG